MRGSLMFMLGLLGLAAILSADEYETPDFDYSDVSTIAPPPDYAYGFFSVQDKNDTNLVWALSNHTKQPVLYNCATICRRALTGYYRTFHQCDPEVELKSPERYAEIVSEMGLGTCKKGGCWGGSTPSDPSLHDQAGMVWIHFNKNAKPWQSTTLDPWEEQERECYFPNIARSAEFGVTKMSCHSKVMNANCYGRRFQSICPCRAVEGGCLEKACPPSRSSSGVEIGKSEFWPKEPDFPSREDNEDEYRFENTPRPEKYYENEETGCLQRVNYWRRRACEEKWKECPPEGLPPLKENKAVRGCVDAQSKYDVDFGSHASFTQCGELSQASTFGRNCADAIDYLILNYKYKKPGERRGKWGNGPVGTCNGHCGGIMRKGCDAFSWGRTYKEDPKEFAHFTFNWGGGSGTKAAQYCNNPKTQNGVTYSCTDGWDTLIERLENEFPNGLDGADECTNYADRPPSNDDDDNNDNDDGDNNDNDDGDSPPPPKWEFEFEFCAMMEPEDVSDVTGLDSNTYEPPTGPVEDSVCDDLASDVYDVVNGVGGNKLRKSTGNKCGNYGERCPGMEDPGDDRYDGLVPVTLDILSKGDYDSKDEAREGYMELLEDIDNENNLFNEPYYAASPNDIDVRKVGDGGDGGDDDDDSSAGALGVTTSLFVLCSLIAILF